MRVLWWNPSQAGVVALEQQDKGKSTLVGLVVLGSGECCCEQGMWGISQGKDK